MKKILICFILCFLSVVVKAQNSVILPTVKKIEVTSSSEKEVTPDIIYLNVNLKEYFLDSNNKNKVSIDKIEKEFHSIAISAGIPAQNIKIDNVSGYNVGSKNKKKDSPDFLAKKQYKIKLTNIEHFNILVSELDPKCIESIYISEFTHSKIEDYKIELKLEAVKKAKQKAEMLLSAIGEEIGGALEVYDIEVPTYYNYRNSVPAAAMSLDSQEGAQLPQIDIKTIKIKADIKAVFFIK